MDTFTIEQMNVSFDTEKEPDLTIICRHKRYSVHKAFVCSLSEFFEGACRNAFREAKDGVFDLSEDDPEAIEHMLYYIYHLDYLPQQEASLRGVPILSEPKLSTSDKLCTKFTRKMLNFATVEDPLLTTADSVVLPPYPSPSIATLDSATPLTPPATATSQTREPPWLLSAASSCNNEEELVGMFDMVSIPDQQPDHKRANLIVHTNVYAIADQYGVLGLKDLAKKKFATQLEHHCGSSEFAVCLREVYQTTPPSDRGLRDILIGTFRKSPELIRRRDVEDSVKRTPDLAWDLCMMVLGLPV